MCSQKLRITFLLLVLSLLFLSCPPYSSCYAEVVLTDAEAQEMMDEISMSKVELTELQKELKESKNTSIEQKKYYETQLTEARKEKEKYKTCSTIGATSSIILTIVCIVAFIL